MAFPDDESFYRAIVEAQTEFVSVARASGELIYVNPAYAQHFGREPAAMIGSNLLDFVDPGDREAVLHRMARVFATGETVVSENRMLGADGAECWLAWRNLLLLDAQGNQLLHSVGRDITQSKLTEEALRSSQAFLDRTGRVAQIGGWEIDFIEHKVTWSEEMRRIFEVGSDYVPTLDDAFALDPSESRSIIEAVSRATLKEGNSWDLELPMTTAKGRRLWVHVAGETEFGMGRPVRLVGAFQDVTERRLLEQRLADSERLLRDVTDSVPALISLVDRELRFRFVNRTYKDWFGIDPGKLVGLSLREFYGEEVWSQIEPYLMAALAGREVTYERELVGSAGRRHAQATLVPQRDPAGNVLGLYTLVSDITPRRDAEQALQESEARLRTMADALPMRVAYVDRDERYRFGNLAYARAFGLSSRQIQGRKMRELLGDAEYGSLESHIRAALNGEMVTFRSETTKAGRYFSSEAHYLPQRAVGCEDVVGFHVVITDITLQKLEERRLVNLTRVDPLTGVLNRAGFDLQLMDSMGRSRANRSLVALMYLDIDHFKEINDRLGHLAGDALLRDFASRLSRTLRSRDAVARLGGDEFAVIIEDLPRPEDASRIAAKIIRLTGTPFIVDREPLTVTVSIGLAFCHGDDKSAEVFMKQADEALYQAKAAGRNTYRLSLRVIEGGRSVV